MDCGLADGSNEVHIKVYCNFQNSLTFEVSSEVRELLELIRTDKPRWVRT